jgi:predicted nucleotidyltransferase
MTKEEILKKLKENKDYIQKQYKVSKIGLFGSYAKDKQTESSDIDFYVIFKEKTIDNITGLWLYLEKIFNKKIDLFTHHSKMRQGLKKQIEKEVIYG